MSPELPEAFQNFQKNRPGSRDGDALLPQQARSAKDVYPASD